MKIMLAEKDTIMEMANVRGKFVKVPEPLSFSFYFSSKSGVNHPIRVKPMFNSEKLISSLTGTLKLCDDWAFIPGKNDTNVSTKAINKMKQFFKENIVLFAMVWDEQLQDGTLEYYFTGLISFEDMIKDIEFYSDYRLQMQNIKSVKELDQFCRNYKLVNFYGN